MCVNVLYFQIIMPVASKYMTDDLNEVASFWCGTCEVNIMLWGDALYKHVAEKHPELFGRGRGRRLCAPMYYVKAGHFKVNYDTFHACYECGEVVMFAEYYMRKHFKGSRHTQGNLSTFEEYLPNLIALKSDPCQIHIESKTVVWQDLLNLLPGGPLPPLGGGNHMTQENVVSLWSQVYQLSGGAELDLGLQLESMEDEDGAEDAGEEFPVLDVQEGLISPYDGYLEARDDEDEDGRQEFPVLDDHEESESQHDVSLEEHDYEDEDEDQGSQYDGPLGEHEDDFDYDYDYETEDAFEGQFQSEVDWDEDGCQEFLVLDVQVESESQHDVSLEEHEYEDEDEGQGSQYDSPLGEHEDDLDGQFQSEVEVDIRCDECQFLVSNENELREHNELHRGTEEKQGEGEKKGHEEGELLDEFEEGELLDNVKLLQVVEGDGDVLVNQVFKEVGVGNNVVNAEYEVFLQEKVEDLVVDEEVVHGEDDGFLQEEVEDLLDVVKEGDEGVLKEEVEEFVVVGLVMDEGQEDVIGRGVKRKKNNTPGNARLARRRVKKREERKRIFEQVLLDQQGGGGCTAGSCADRMAAGWEVRRSGGWDDRRIGGWDDRRPGGWNDRRLGGWDDRGSGGWSVPW